METICLLRNLTITAPPGSSVLLMPPSYTEGEPTVTYVTATASLVVLQRAVADGDNFLAMQLAHGTADVTGGGGENMRVDLTGCPVFRDTVAFSTVLDFLNRLLDGPATLRTADMSLTEAQWASLVDLERFVFYGPDRNPYWTGITGQDYLANGTVCTEFVFQPAFSVRITPARLTVNGPNGFAFTVDLTRLTNPPTRPVSLLAGPRFGRFMEFPFPVDFVNSFFIPHTAIACAIDGRRTDCEGVLHSDGRLRIEPVDTEAFRWFHFEITPRFLCNPRLWYGA
jgi:hypothetical protein